MTESAPLLSEQHVAPLVSRVEPEVAPSAGATGASPPTGPTDDELRAAMKFASVLVARTQLQHTDPSDLLEAGCFAIAEAARYWRAERGAFGPYARTAIRRAVRRVFTPDPRARVDALDVAPLMLSEFDGSDGDESGLDAGVLLPHRDVDPEAILLALERAAEMGDAIEEAAPPKRTQRAARVAA